MAASRDNDVDTSYGTEGGDSVGAQMSQAAPLAHSVSSKGEVSLLLTSLVDREEVASYPGGAAKQSAASSSPHPRNEEVEAAGGEVGSSVYSEIGLQQGSSAATTEDVLPCGGAGDTRVLAPLDGNVSALDKDTSRESRADMSLSLHEDFDKPALSQSPVTFSRSGKEPATSTDNNDKLPSDSDKESISSGDLAVKHVNEIREFETPVACTNGSPFETASDEVVSNLVNEYQVFESSLTPAAEERGDMGFMTPKESSPCEQASDEIVSNLVNEYQVFELSLTPAAEERGDMGFMTPKESPTREHASDEVVSNLVNEYQVFESSLTPAAEERGDMGFMTPKESVPPFNVNLRPVSESPLAAKAGVPSKFTNDYDLNFVPNPLVPEESNVAAVNDSDANVTNGTDEKLQSPAVVNDAVDTTHASSRDSNESEALRGDGLHSADSQAQNLHQGLTGSVEALSVAPRAENQHGAVLPATADGPAVRHTPSHSHVQTSAVDSNNTQSVEERHATPSEKLRLLDIASDFRVRSPPPLSASSRGHTHTIDARDGLPSAHSHDAMEPPPAGEQTDPVDRSAKQNAASSSSSGSNRRSSLSRFPSLQAPSQPNDGLRVELDRRVSQEQARRNLTNLSDRLQYRRDLRSFMNRLNDVDRQAWDRSKGIASMVKLRVSRIVAAEQDAVKFLRQENAIREHAQRTRRSFGAAHPSTEWVSQLWKAAAFTHPTDEHGDQKAHAALCQSIIHVDQHFAELQDLVSRVDSHAANAQASVEQKWGSYLNDLNEEIDALEKGVHPFEDSYLSRRAYEHEVGNLSDYDYEASLSTIIKDVALSEERRLADSKGLLLDFFTKEENALKEQLALVSKARQHIDAIDPEEHVAQFLDHLSQYSHKYGHETRETLSARSLLPSEIIKQSSLRMFKPSTDKKRSVTASDEPRGKWEPCFAVLTVAGFLHVFSHEQALTPLLSFSLQSITGVAPSLKFGNSAHVFQFNDQTRLRWYEVFAELPTFNFKCESPLLMHEWMSALQSRVAEPDRDQE